MAEPPQKRFRYATYTEQIRNISVDTGKTRPLAWNEDDAEGSDQHTTPFTSELERLSLLDLTLPFQELQKTLRPLTSTLPITLHNLPSISSAFHDFYSRHSTGNDLVHSGLESALQLQRAIFETTLGEAVPYAPEAASDICRIASLRSLDPKIVERAYSTLSLILRTIASALLRPDTSSQAALRDTWNAVKPYLATAHKQYVRRCVADAWTGVVRKARGDGLARLVKLLLEESGEGMEAVWAHSLKGSSGQLHSRALPILELLLDNVETAPTEEKIVTLNKVVTAMIHHTSSTTFAPVAELLIKRQSTSPSPGAVANLRLMATALAVRKGKRYPESMIKPAMMRLMEAIPALQDPSSDSAWHKWYMQAVIGSLVAGKLAQWLSPGVTLIERLWDAMTPEERFAFVNALIKLRWSGVEQFLIPHIARTVLPSLSTDPLHTLVLLNNLAEAGFLTGSLSNVQGGRWRQALVSALVAQVKSLESTEDIASRRILGQILHLLPSLSSEGEAFAPYIAATIENVVRKPTASDLSTFANDGPWNDAHLLAEALLAAHAVSHDSAVRAELKRKLLDSGMLATITQRWAWNREDLEQAASLVGMWQDEISPPNWQLEHLHANLLSSDSLLRLSSLRILATISKSTSTTSTSGPTSDVWSACLAVESSEMSLRNVRERTTEIARLTRLLTSMPTESATVITHVISYLLSQLKVNFRPLYAETVKALAELGGKHGDAVWHAIWTELEKVSRAESATVPDIGVVRPSWANAKAPLVDQAPVDEEEPEYRCPNFERATTAVEDSWSMSSDVQTLDIAEIPSQISRDRLDVINYEAQLLNTLALIPLVAEKHTRLIIPAFFAIANQLENSDDATLSARLSTRQRQARTANWLELFAKFVNPKAAYRSDELHQLYLRILSKGDVKLQDLAVNCLMTYKSPNLTPYADSLRNLLDDSKFRDELAHFALGQDSETINETHRVEIIPVTIRLLYGLLTTRRGRSSAQGLQARKRAVLSALSGCSSDELKVLIDLMLEPFEHDDDADTETAGRQQIGYLSLLADVLKYLAPQTTEHWPRLITVTIALISKAQARIDHEADGAMDVDVDDIDEVEESSGGVPVRQIRSIAIKRLVLFLRAPVDFNFEPFLEPLFEIVISPRLAKLEVENTQAPSGVLDLVAAIAASPDHAPALVRFDDRTLPKTFACFTAVKVKPAVISRVFDIIDSLLERDSHDILLAHIRPLLDNVIRFVEGRAHSANDDLMRRLLAILSRVSAIVTDGQQAQELASLLCPMLRSAGKQQPEKMKVHVLQTLQRLLTISPDFSHPTSDFVTRSYDLLSNLLQTVFLPSTRRAVVAALQTFIIADATLAPTIQLVSDLNAYSARRLDEPDFDKRLTAFASFNDAEQSALPTTMREWTPLLRSALFFIKDPEELSLRTNSSALLKRFVDLVGTSDSGPFVDAMHHIVLPGLRQSIRSRNELVRNEALVVIAHAVNVCEGVPLLVELRPLSGDDDASFFVNISHIQVHRRARALRRLRETLAEHEIRETTIANFFLPILEHVIAGATEVTDHHFVNEAITTVGALAKTLRWSRYNGVLTRYLKLGNVKSAQQKLYVRTVSAIIDHFHFDLLAEVDQVEDDADQDADPDADPEAEANPEADKAQLKRISDIVLNRLLPSLSKFVSQKDENEDSIRIPLALPTVKLANQLPADVASNEIIRVITIVSQILRSKDQDTRDIARDTMGKIAVYLGPEWLTKILGELQTALQRGPQKHVAGVVTHSILALATTDSPARFGNLDDSVNDAVRISAEVVWGESGKDAANEGYKTKMREVRGATSRGFDTFQLLARLVSPAKISVLLAPIREVMHASQAVKTMTQVDEALRRVALGLNANAKIMPEDVLTLCYSLISGNSAYLKPKRKAAPTSQTPDAFRVQMKRNKAADDDFYHLNAYKFVMFGLDLFVTAFRRGRFDFDNTDILSRLGPLVSAIGNTLYSPAASVMLLGLKASAAIARCPIPQVDSSLPTFVSNIIKIVKNQGGSAETEVAQTALKTLAVILRDCKASQLTDSQLRYLLDCVSPDLEEPDRQASIFALLRAIVSRRMVVPEVYDLMSSVSSVMVTSQSTHVQDQCRGVLMAFLLDYPQGKGRIRSQLTFLAQNLDYVYETGRVSVMELLNAVFTKFSEELIAEYADLFFVALVAVIANDESEKCRIMAGALLQVLLGRLESGKVASMVDVLKSWVGAREAQPALAGASLAVFGLLADVPDVDAAIVDDMLVATSSVISDSAEALAEAENDDTAFPATLDHTLPHYALAAVSKGFKLTPGSVDELPWEDIIAHLLFPHDWVRLAAAKCIASLMAVDMNKLNDGACLDIARKSCVLLQGSRNAEGDFVTLDSKVADQLVKLLWNIAKRWSTQADAEPDAQIEADAHEADEEAPAKGGSLSWLMSRVSFVARHIIVHRPSLTAMPTSSTHWTSPLLSILRFFAGVMDHLQQKRAARYLVHVLSPIYRILDEGGDLTAESGPQIDDLKQLATEVRDLVQTKVGTSVFSRTWESMRQRVAGKREERRDARNRLAFTDPKAFADRRSKKVVNKKDSKKRRVKAFAEGRVQSNHLKRRS